MTGVRIEIDLDKIGENARTLVDRLGAAGISVTGVTKAALGSPELAAVLVDAGVAALGDSRVENLERLRAAGIGARTLLLRSPMLSQVDRVVRCADVSCNTEPSVIRALSAAAGAADVRHGIILMVELGDLREGIRPLDVCDVVDSTLALPHLAVTGIGTNLACRNGIAPDDRNMQELAALASSLERSCGITLDVVSGGNSANLAWFDTTADTGRVNDLRLGEAILLGREPLRRRPVPGLHTDAVTISAEVIESKRKPSLPWGTAEESAFGPTAAIVDRGEIWQTIVAIGHQDTDPDGLVPPPGATILGASSDHLVLETTLPIEPGRSLCFRPDYSAVLRAMTSPFVVTTTTGTHAVHGGASR